jgi:hypothetical protein
MVPLIWRGLALLPIEIENVQVLALVGVPVWAAAPVVDVWLSQQAVGDPAGQDVLFVSVSAAAVLPLI